MTSDRINRRDFIKMTGVAGTASLLGSSLSATPVDESRDSGGREPGKPVRIAFIGVGSRGTYLLGRLLKWPEVEVAAICDINTKALDRAVKIVEDARGRKPAGFSAGPYDYRNLLDRADFEGVLIATDAELHAEMSCDAMRRGKHVGSEVPGASTMDDCRNLVKTKEETGRHYMLLENYCYGRDVMQAMRMTRENVFGETYYAECAYIHDCRDLRFNDDQSLTWRGKRFCEQFGNLYPTHAVGPTAKMLDIHRGDRFTSLVSRMSRPAAMKEYAVQRFGEDSKAAGYDWKQGDMNVTLLETAKGKMVTVYYDTNSPRPGYNYYLVQGTRGIFDTREGVYIDGKSPSKQHYWDKIAKHQDQYDHHYWKTYEKEALKAGHGGADYFTLLDFINMVRDNREPAIDVYDGAAWSCIMPLSRKSIEQGGSAVEMPDFTGGRWKQKVWPESAVL